MLEQTIDRDAELRIFFTSTSALREAVRSNDQRKARESLEGIAAVCLYTDNQMLRSRCSVVLKDYGSIM